MIPETLNEVAKMYNTLDLLYKWKYHHQWLVAIVSSAITSTENERFLDIVVVKDPLEIECTDDESENNNNSQDNDDEEILGQWDEFEESPNVLFSPATSPWAPVIIIFRLINKNFKLLSVLCRGSDKFRWNWMKIFLKIGDTDVPWIN